MNTVYPNKGRRRFITGPLTPGSRVFPLSSYKVVDIGDGFWGVVTGRNVNLTRDIPTNFLVVGNVGVNPSVEMFNASTAFVLSN